MKLHLFTFYFILFSSIATVAQQDPIDSLKKLLNGKQDTLNAHNFLEVAFEYDQVGELDSEIVYGKKALALSEHLNYARGIARSHYRLGVAYCNLQDIAASKKELSVAVAMFKTLGMKQAESNAYSYLGTVSMYEADFAKSIFYFLSRLKIEEEFHNEEGMLMAYNNLGSVYFYNEDYDKSLEYFLKCIPVLKKTDANGIGDVYCNIGNLYNLKNMDTVALGYYKRALESKRQDKNQTGLASIYNNMGETYLKLKSYTDALINFEEALKEADASSDKRNQVAAYLHMGTVYRHLKQYPTSIVNYEKALALARSNNFKKEVKTGYLDMSLTYAAMNNYKEAYNYHLLFTQVSDSIFSSESQEQVNELSAKFETEKKDKELILKDAEIEKQLLNAKQKSQQRDFFIAGFALMILLAFLAFRSYRLKRKANKEISIQKEIIQQKNKEIIDSINYARRIQRAQLPTNKYIDKTLLRLKNKS